MSRSECSDDCRPKKRRRNGFCVCGSFTSTHINVEDNSVLIIRCHKRNISLREVLSFLCCVLLMINTLLLSYVLYGSYYCRQKFTELLMYFVQNSCDECRAPPISRKYLTSYLSKLKSSTTLSFISN